MSKDLEYDLDILKLKVTKWFKWSMILCQVYSRCLFFGSFMPNLTVNNDSLT